MQKVGEKIVCNFSSSLLYSKCNIIDSANAPREYKTVISFSVVFISIVMEV